MGGKGGGSQTSTTTSSLPPEVVAAYKDVTGKAQGVASAPLQQYQGNIVAPFSDMQNQAFSGLNAAQGAYQPYFNQAQGLIGQGTQQYTPTQFSANAVGQYESPYTQDVINSTMANINQENAKQQSSLQGNAIAKGAWGGDRADLARNDLARQQSLASGQTIAGLENQNYAQALGQFNQSNQMGLQSAGLNNQAALQGAGLQGAMGNYAQANQLNAANAQLQGGSLQQQLAQAQLMVPYQQFQQQQAYPFQTTQYLANIVEGLGNQGGTSTTTQPKQGANSMFGFLGLKSGGKVNGYASGGIVPNGYYPGGPVGEMNPFGIPDLSQSYVPITQPAPMQSQSSIPQAPHIDQAQQKQTTLNDLISTGKNLSGIGNSIAPYAKGIGKFGSSMLGGSSLGESAAFGMNAAGYGNAAYDMLAASDAAAAAGTAATAGTAAAASAPEWLTALMAFFNKGGAVHGYDKGGIVGYANGGWQSQPLFDSPMYSPQSALDAESRGILPSNGQVGGLPLSPSMNNKLAALLSDPAAGTAMSMSDPLGGNMAAMRPNPLADSGMSSDIISKLAALNKNASPGTMQALNSGVMTAQTNPMPNGIAVAQNSIPAPPTMAGQPQQPVIDQPPALTDLQATLSKNAPVLDKDAAIWTGIAGAMAGKNRGILQNVGEGLQAGLGAYGQQKAAVAEYTLKQAEAEKRAEQLAVEAARYNKQLSIEQQNADTNAGYRKDMAAAATKNAETKAKQVVGALDSDQTNEVLSKSGLDAYKALKQYDPTTAEYAYSIANAESPWPTVNARNPQAKQMIAMAKAINPDVNSNSAAAIKAFQTGKQGDAVGQMNAGFEHWLTLGRLVEDMNSGNVQKFNDAKNKLSAEFGSSKVTNYDTAKNVYANEMTKFLSGVGGGSLEDRNAVKADLDAKLSTVQKKGSLDIFKELTGGQLKRYAQQYKTSTGQHNFDRLLLPEVVQAFYPAPSQDAINHLKEHPEMANQFREKFGRDPKDFLDEQ